MDNVDTLLIEQVQTLYPGFLPRIKTPHKQEMFWSQGRVHGWEFPL